MRVEKSLKDGHNQIVRGKKEYDSEWVKVCYR